MNAQVAIPAGERHDAVDVRGQRAQNGGGAEGEGLRRPCRPAAATTARPTTTCVSGSMAPRSTRGLPRLMGRSHPSTCRSDTSTRAAARMRALSWSANSCAALWIASSRGLFRSTKIGSPARTMKRPGRRRSMKHGSSGAPVMNAISAGVLRNQARRPRNVHLDTIAADVAIHQQGDDAVRREAPADLKRRSSDWPTSIVSAPTRSRISRRSRLTVRVAFGHGDDRDRHLHHRRMKTPPTSQLP